MQSAQHTLRATEPQMLAWVHKTLIAERDVAAALKATVVGNPRGSGVARDALSRNGTTARR